MSPRHSAPRSRLQTVTLQNPLVIDDDAQWQALTKTAGWKFPNPFGLPEEQVQRDVAALGDHIRGLGHDGVVVRLSDPAKSDKTKTMRKVFGADQVAAFDEAQAAAPVPPPPTKPVPEVRVGFDEPPLAPGPRPEGDTTKGQLAGKAVPRTQAELDRALDRFTREGQFGARRDAGDTPAGEPAATGDRYGVARLGRPGAWLRRG